MIRRSLNGLSLVSALARARHLTVVALVAASRNAQRSCAGLSVALDLEHLKQPIHLAFARHDSRPKTSLERPRFGMIYAASPNSSESMG
jgi:hypothetical protein